MIPGNVETMDRFNGLEIPESLHEVLEPGTLACVVYDMQVGILRQLRELYPRNRLVVLFEWAWAYLTGKRAARLITGSVDRTRA